MNDNAGGVDLQEYVARVERELNGIIARQREVIEQVLKEPAKSVPYCGIVHCERLRGYRHALEHAVHVLADTRRSFKSPQLEQLRKQLEAVLAQEFDH